MNTIIAIIIGFLLGSLVMRIWKRRKSEPAAKSLIDKQAEEKSENLQKVLALFEQKEQVTNSDVENLLGVSDATATNYLEELEKEGKIRQVGETGRSVYYELNR